MNVLLIYPKFSEATFWEPKPSLKDIGHRQAQMPPLGLLTIASYLPEDFELRLIDRNVAEESEADWRWADVVFLSLMYIQVADYQICIAKAKQYGKPVAVGGPFTHGMPEVATAGTDWVCFGEAEAIMDRFVEDLRANRRGIHYQGGNKTDMEQVKMPRFDLLPDINAYHVMAVQFSRGCPFQCEFCDIIEIYGRIPRAKTPAQAAAELTVLKRLGFQGPVFLVDDNFIGNKRNAKYLLKALAEWNRANANYFHFITEATINLADEAELLQLMSDANFISVYVGIETPDPILLQTTQKQQNIPGNPLEKVRRIRAAGLHVMAGFIVGFDGEKRNVFEVQKEFIHQSGIGIAMMALLEAGPHTQLTRRLIKEGRLLAKLPLTGSITCEGINFIPKGGMTRREYLERYAQSVQEIFEPRAFYKRIYSALMTLRRKARLRGTLALARTRYPFMARLCYCLGLKSSGGRRHFWKTFLAILLKNPGALPGFCLDCYYYYHFRQHVDYIRRKFAAYLDTPLPDDVLDVVIPADELPAVAAATSVSAAQTSEQMVAL